MEAWMQSRRIISMGSRKRVGDGKSIWIFDDPWLPKECFGRVFSPFILLPAEARVEALIDLNLWW